MNCCSRIPENEVVFNVVGTIGLMLLIIVLAFVGFAALRPSALSRQRGPEDQPNSTTARWRIA